MKMCREKVLEREGEVTEKAGERGLEGGRGKSQRKRDLENRMSRGGGRRKTDERPERCPSTGQLIQPRENEEELESCL